VVGADLQEPVEDGLPQPRGVTAGAQVRQLFVLAAGLVVPVAEAGGPQSGHHVSSRPIIGGEPAVEQEWPGRTDEIDARLCTEHAGQGRNWRHGRVQRKISHQITRQLIRHPFPAEPGHPQPLRPVIRPH
jgi:hypothetical protein